MSEVGEGGFGGEEGAAEVLGELVVPRFGGDRFDAAAAGAGGEGCGVDGAAAGSGVVDEDIDATEGGGDRLDRLPKGSFEDDIAGEADAGGGEGGGGEGGLLAVEVEDGDVCALARHDGGDTGADATGAAGDDGNFAVEGLHWGFLSARRRIGGRRVAESGVGGAVRTGRSYRRASKPVGGGRAARGPGDAFGSALRAGWGRWALAAGEAWLALFDEGGDGFAGVGGEASEALIEGFLVEELLEGGGLGEGEVFFHAGVGSGGPLGEAAAVVEPLAEELVVGEDAIDDAEVEGSGRIEDFGREVEFAGEAGPAEALEEVRTAEISGEADVAEGSAEAGAFGGEADVAGEGDGESGAYCGTVDEGDDGLGHGVDAESDLVMTLAQLGDEAVELGDDGAGACLCGGAGDAVVAFLHAADIAAGAEGAAGAGDGDAADGGVGFDGGEGFRELGDEVAPHGVECLGAVEGNEREGIAALEEDIGHVSLRLGGGGDGEAAVGWAQCLLS